ncbi:hypothetical protein BMS3Bbin08_02124 [bacterium BMS3Bbin08]|nr:hypothetical protein BMS3Bbin08_02124 [bacterium BMS3Bbin08]
MFKYFIYCRKSTEEEERQILSIEAQLTELREYAKREGLLVLKEFTESKTAKEPGRPVFNQMLSEIEQGPPSLFSQRKQGDRASWRGILTDLLAIL